MSDAFAVADRFFAAVAAGDLDAVASIYAPDATIWLNTTGARVDVAGNLRVLKWLGRVLTDRRYDVIRRQATPEGFVQQHVLRGTLADGSAFAMDACIVAAVMQGRITRLDEYLDSRAADRLNALAKS